MQDPDILPEDEPTAIQGGPREEKSRTPCIVLPVVGIFVLVLCYVTIVVVRNISPTAIRETDSRHATATALSTNAASVGATVAAELEYDATQTALTAPSPVTTGTIPLASPQLPSTVIPGPAP